MADIFDPFAESADTAAPQAVYDPFASDDVEPAAASAAAPTPEPTSPDLVPPNTTMFDYIGDAKEFLDVEDQRALLESEQQRYKDAPGYEDRNDFFLGDSYLGNRMPRFYIDPLGDVVVENSALVEGVRDAATNTAITVADLTDMGRSALGTEVTNENSYGQALDDYFTEYDERRPLQGFAGEAAGLIGTGFGAGAFFRGLAKQVTKKFGKRQASKKIAEGLATGVGLEVGAVAGADGDSSGILLGKDPLLNFQEDVPLLRGIELDPDSPEYQERLANRMNLLMEGGALGLAAEAGINLTVSLGKLALVMSANTVTSLLGKSSVPKAQQDMVREISDALYAAENAATPRDQETFLIELADAIRNNEQVVLSTADDFLGPLTADQSSMNAFLVAWENGDIAVALETLERAKSLQSGTTGQPLGTSTALASQQTVRAADEGFERAQDILDGPENIPRVTADQQARGLAEVGAANQVVADLNTEIAALKEALEIDPNFEKVLASIQNKTGIELSADTLASNDAMRENLVLAYTKMTNTRNELYGEVTGGYLDVTDMVSKLREITPDRLQMAASTMPSGPMKTLLNMAEPPPTTKMVDGAEIPKTDEEILADEAAIVTAITDELAKVGVDDYGSFFKVIRSELAQVKQSLFEAGQQGAVAARGPARDFEKFVNYIDDDLLKLADEDGLSDAVEAAKKYDREEFLVNWRGEGPLARIAKSYDINMRSKAPLNAQSADEIVEEGGQVGLDFDGAVDEFSAPPIKSSADEITFAQNVDDTIAENLPQSRYGAQLIQGLRMSGVEGAEDAAYDYILSDVLGTLGSRQRGDAGYSPEDIRIAVDALSKYGSVLRQEFPEAADKLVVLQKDILNGKRSLESLEADRAVAFAAAEEVSNEVFKGKFNAFFDANNAPMNTGQKIWDQVFKQFRDGDTLTPENIGKFDKLVSAIRDTSDPELIKGVQAAYLDTMRRKFFTTTKTSLGTKQMSMATIENNMEFGRWMEGLEIVFREADGTAPVADIFKTLLARAGNEQAAATRIKSLAINSTTSDKQRQVQALNSIVTMFFGPLSRKGARIGAAGRRLINQQTNKDMYESVTDQVMSNPKLFADVLDQVIKQDFRQPYLMYLAFIKGVNKAGMISENDERITDPLDKNLFDAALETESMLNNSLYEAEETGKGFLERAQDQMRALFQ